MMKSLVSTSLLLIFICIVEGSYIDFDTDGVCNENNTKGLYIQHPSCLSDLKCCKETLLHLPSPLQYARLSLEYNMANVNATDPMSYVGPTPAWAFCRYNVSRDNQEDDFATLMWKTEACIIQTFTGKSEDAIDFQTFVDFRTAKYSNKNNMSTIVKKANTECPGTEGIQLHKRIEAYTWCFYRNEEKVCNEPTKEAKKYQDSYFQDTGIELLTTPSCLLNLTTKGVDLYNCCNGKSTPIEWSSWHKFPEPSYNMTEPGNHVPVESYTKCARGVAGLQAYFNISTRSASYLITNRCRAACSLNPIVFKDATKVPKINWGFKKAFFSFTNFNDGITKDLTKISGQFKQTYKIRGDNQYINQTGLTFNEIEKAYKDSNDPIEKLILYCNYYGSLHTFSYQVLRKYCDPSLSNQALGIM